MKAEAEMNDDQAEVNSRRSRKGGRRRTRALTSEMGGGTSRMRLAREVKMTRACSKVKGCRSSTMSERSTKHHRHSKWVEVKMKNVKLMPGVDVMMTRRRGNHEGNIVDAAPIV